MTAVHVFRGEHLESTHDAHIAVVNNKGELLYFYGDPYRLTFARSSMKPFQAIPLVETGAADHFNYSDAELALACASHSGESFHRETVHQILERIQQPEEALQCGTHIPRDIEGYKELIRSGGDLTPVFSNCSGKHSGMLVTAVHMNEDVNSYREVGHPVQQRIIKAISEVCDFEVEQIKLSVDGCGVPVHQLPLNHSALGFANLAVPNDSFTTERKQTLLRIGTAMATKPEMVGGTKRFDTDLMKVFGGRIVAKAGAEAVQCIGDKETGLGIAIKIEDGNGRATSVVAMEVLKQLGIAKEDTLSKLKEYVHAPVKNMRDNEIGVIKPNFTLRKVL